MKQYKRLILLIFLIGGLSLSPGLPAAVENAATLAEWNMLLEKSFEVYQKGDLKEAHQWAQKSYDYAIQHFGHQHAVTLDSLSTLAFLHHLQDNYQQAESLYKQAITLSEAIRGAKHAKTLTIRKRLANLLLEKTFEVLQKGNLKEAHQWAQKSYDYAIEHFGHQHAATLDSLSTLASLHHLQDNYQQAESLYKQAITLSEAIWGAKHAKTLTIRKRLANLYQGMQTRYQAAEQKAKKVVAQWNALRQRSSQAYQQGQFEEALQWAQKSYAYARQHLNYPNLSAVLTSLVTLSSMHHAMGHYTQAESMYKEALTLSETTLGAKHETTIMLRNNLAGLYYEQARYKEAKTAYEELLLLWKEIGKLKDWRAIGTMSSLGEVYQALGDLPRATKFLTQARDLMEEVQNPSNTEALLVVTNNLALLYKEQGRYEEAEQLIHKVLTQSLELLGSKHPKTLMVRTNLAGIYQNQGNYRKALTLYEKLQPLAEEILGPEHPMTLKVLNNLASIYYELGRYGEAEQIYQTLCPRQERALGETHPNTLICVSSLMSIYHVQRRYQQALTLSETVLSKFKEQNDIKEPNMIEFLSRLGSLYETLNRFEEAEGFYYDAAKLAEDIFGIRHPRSLSITSKIGVLYYKQSLFGDKIRYAEAEKRLESVLQLRKEVLGTNHPDTLSSLANLAFVYQTQGHYQKARQLYHDAAIIPRLTETFDKQHPHTLYTQLSYIMLLIVMGENQQALQLLSLLEKNWLGHAESQLYTTQKEHVRLRVLLSLASFQDVALSLALRDSSAETWQFAGNMILHWKQVLAEEQAIIAKLVQTSTDEQVIKLGKNILTLRARLAHQIHLAYSELPPEELTRLVNELETKELALAKRGQYHKPRLQAADVNLEQVRAKLPPNSALIAFKHYRTINFKQGLGGEFRWAAMLLPAGTNKMIFKDLGPPKDTLELWNTLRKTGTEHDAAALYQNLFGPFETEIKGMKTLYIAPDGFLNLIPFSRLVLPDGRYWIERQTLRQIQTGRDLLREKPTPSSDGLLAIGNVNFDAFPKKRRPQPKRQNSETIENHRGLVKKKLRFKRLKHSRSEIKQIKENYPTPSEMWTGKNASEGRLKGLTQVPRVLHLATHAFYLDNSSGDVDIVRPLTLSGIALAGANRGLKGKLDPDGEDGILYSLEALNLNLTGTELVVFSACETGKGVIDYSEGVYGLVRAFKIAGAYRLLM
ncbi:MAG: hypothetical protein DRR19_23210, partial [Candidatus Parabeggiatoa sp. nov. 1]